MKKKILSVLLVTVMLLTMIPMGAVSVSAATFSPRLTAPSKSGYYGIQTSMNPFRVNTSAGGGNCTWYAWGRAYEILGSRPKLSTGNACTWYPNNQSNGNYPYGSEPKLGAIICWSGGSSGAGHVAVVEQIHSDGSMTVSESSWSATTWWFRTREVNKNGDYYSNYSLQGYIYLTDHNGSIPNSSSTNPDDYTFPTRSLYYTTPTMTGSDVAWVQAVLNKLGFSVAIDGKYGPTTRDIIKQFQTKYGLEADGKCGPITRAKLQELWNAKKCTHTYSNACDATCNKCGATRTPSAHVYSNTCDTTCNTCGATRSITHSYSAATCIKPKTCSVCGHTQGSALGHTYDHACDTICNTCGATRSITHSYSAATCTTPKTCSVCGATSGSALGHAYDNDYDADCNVCGEEREVDLPADAPAFVVESTSAREGQEFTVAIRTQRNSGIVSLKLNVTYDADVLELVDAVEMDFDGTSFGPLTNTPFIVNWFDALRPDNTTDGVVALLTFRVKEGVPIGKTDITLSYDPADVFDQNYDNVAFRTENGVVEIVDYMLGDANGDGAVNNRDLAMMQQFINGWEVVVDADACDVNVDGAINNRDLALLQQYINGWDVTLGKK